MLIRIFRLQVNHTKINSAVLAPEKEAFLAKLNSLKIKASSIEKIKAILETPAAASDSSAFPYEEALQSFGELLEALPPDFTFKPYENLRLQIQSQILQSELKSDLLAAETEKLESAITEKLIRTETERKLVAFSKNYRLLKKLFRLELTLKEYQSIGHRPETTGEKASSSPHAFRRGSPSRFPTKTFGNDENNNSLRPSVLIEQFLALNSDKRTQAVRFSHLDEIDHLFGLALSFYAGARKRDSIMANNALKVIQHFKQDSAILVTGGFHSQGIKEYFESKGFSYYLITPSIKEIGDNKAYRAAMLEENKSILTSQITNILMMQRRRKAIQESRNPKFPDYRAGQVAIELKTNARASEFEEINTDLLARQYRLKIIRNPQTGSLDFRFVSRSEARTEDTETTLDKLYAEAGISFGELQSTEKGRYVNTPGIYLNHVLETLNISADEKIVILDAGSGKGKATLYLAIEILKKNPEAEIIGIEFDHEMVQDASKVLALAKKKKIIPQNSQIHFLEGDFTSDSFRSIFRRASAVVYAEAGTADTALFAQTLTQNLRQGSRVIAIVKATHEKLKLSLPSADFDAVEDSGFSPLTIYTRRSEAQVKEKEEKPERKVPVRVLFREITLASILIALFSALNGFFYLPWAENLQQNSGLALLSLFPVGIASAVLQALIGQRFEIHVYQERNAYQPGRIFRAILLNALLSVPIYGFLVYGWMMHFVPGTDILPSWLVQALLNQLVLSPLFFDPLNYFWGKVIIERESYQKTLESAKNNLFSFWTIAFVVWFPAVGIAMSFANPLVTFFVLSVTGLAWGVLFTILIHQEKIGFLSAFESRLAKTFPFKYFQALYHHPVLGGYVLSVTYWLYAVLAARLLFLLIPSLFITAGVFTAAGLAWTGGLLYLKKTARPPDKDSAGTATRSEARTLHTVGDSIPKEVFNDPEKMDEMLGRVYSPLSSKRLLKLTESQAIRINPVMYYTYPVYDHWGYNSTTVAILNEKFAKLLGGNLHKFISVRADQKAQKGQKFYVLDWGAGDFTALHQLDQSNARFYGFSRTVYGKQFRIMSRSPHVHAILDDAENFYDYFRKTRPLAKIRFDLIMSHQGLGHFLSWRDHADNYTRYKEHIHRLSGLLAQGGVLIHDLDLNAIPLFEEIQPELEKDYEIKIEKFDGETIAEWQSQKEAASSAAVRFTLKSRPPLSPPGLGQLLREKNSRSEARSSSGENDTFGGPWLEVRGTAAKTAEQILYERWILGSPLEDFVKEIKLETNNRTELKGSFIIRDDLKGNLADVAGTQRHFYLSTNGTGVITDILMSGKGYSEIILWKMLTDLKEAGFKSSLFYVDEGTEGERFFFGSSDHKGLIEQWNEKWKLSGTPSDLIRVNEDTDYERKVIEIPVSGTDLDIVRPFAPFRSEARVNKNTLAKNLVKKYTLDSEKAKSLAALFRKSSVGKAEDKIILSHQGKKLAEILRLGSVRYFDLNGLAILTLDPFRNAIEQLQWSKTGEFQKAVFWNVDRELYAMAPLTGKIPKANVFQDYQQGFIYDVYRANDPSPYSPLRGEFIFYDKGLDLTKYPGRIPGSGFKLERFTATPGLGFSTLNLISYLAKDRGQALTYNGDVPTPMLADSLEEVAVSGIKRKDANDFFGLLNKDNLWAPYPAERIFNPNGLFVSVRNGTIARAFHKGGMSRNLKKTEDSTFILPARPFNLLIDNKGNILKKLKRQNAQRSEARKASGNGGVSSDQYGAGKWQQYQSQNRSRLKLLTNPQLASNDLLGVDIKSKHLRMIAEFRPPGQTAFPSQKLRKSQSSDRLQQPVSPYPSKISPETPGALSSKVQTLNPPNAGKNNTDIINSQYLFNILRISKLTQILMDGIVPLIATAAVAKAAFLSFFGYKLEAAQTIPVPQDVQQARIEKALREMGIPFAKYGAERTTATDDSFGITGISVSKELGVPALEKTLDDFVPLFLKNNPHKILILVYSGSLPSGFATRTYENFERRVFILSGPDAFKKIFSSDFSGFNAEKKALARHLLPRANELAQQADMAVSGPLKMADLKAVSLVAADDTVLNALDIAHQFLDEAISNPEADLVVKLVELPLLARLTTADLIKKQPDKYTTAAGSPNRFTFTSAFRGQLAALADAFRSARHILEAA